MATSPEIRPIGSRWALALLGLFLTWYALLGYFWELQRGEMTYYVTEWFVTYDGGFVRRGLIGQILVSVAKVTKLRPIVAIDGTRILIQSAFFGLVGFLIYKNRLKLGNLGVLLFLTSPFIGFYAWYMSGSLDVSFILITAAHLWIARSRSKEDYRRSAILLFSSFGLLLALSHEVYLFVCLPVNLIIAWRELKEKRVQRLGEIFGLSFIAVLTASLIKVHESQTSQIVRAWKVRGISLPNPSAVSLLTNNLHAQVVQALQDFSAVTAGLWALSVLLSGLPFILWWRQEIAVASPEKKHWLERLRLEYFVLPLICTIPLYVLGNDWHRWISLPVCTGLVCLLVEGAYFKGSISGPKLSPFLGLAILITFFTHPVSLYADRKSIGVGSVTCSVKLIQERLSQFRSKEVKNLNGRK